MITPIDNLVDFSLKNIWLQKLRKEEFGIILPNGWFGKPFDNQHSVKDIIVNNNSLTIVFDDMREITIIDPKAFEIQSVGSSYSSLKLLGSQKIIFKWTPYGEEQTGKANITQFDSVEGNTVELVGYFRS